MYDIDLFKNYHQICIVKNISTFRLWLLAGTFISITTLDVSAQHAPKDNQTVTITVESKDKNGVVTTKKIVRTDENLTETEIQKITDELVKEYDGKDAKIQVNVEEQKAVTADSPDKDQEVIIKKGYGNDMPDDVHIFIDGGMLTDTGRLGENFFSRIFPDSLSKSIGINLDSLVKNLDTKFGKFRTLTRQPFLGVTTDESIQNEQGVPVTEIFEGSAAEKAGLKINDIITNIDGIKVSNFAEMIREIKKHKVGDQITIGYLREGTASTATATLGEKEGNYMPFPGGEFDFNHFKWNPENTPGEDNFSQRRLRRFNADGFYNEAKSDKAQLGVMVENNNDNGVKITDIVEGTAAFHTGLKKGDIIEKINKERINSPEILISVVSAMKPGDEIALTYRRDGKKKTISLVLGAKKESGYYGFEPEMKNNRKTYIFKNKNTTSDVQTDAPLLILENFELFPNPSKGNVNISFKSESDEDATVKILSLDGKEIQRESLKGRNGKFEKTINIKDTKPGAYIVRIEQDGKMITEKFILNR